MKINKSKIRKMIKEIIIKEYVVPMGYSLEGWLDKKEKDKISNKDYTKKTKGDKWKVVHGKTRPNRKGKKGQKLKATKRGAPVNKSATNLSYKKATDYHTAIELSEINNQEYLHESLLIALLTGCTRSDCHLYELSPELENLKIPDCATKEVYPFETLEFPIEYGEFKDLMEEEGYSVEKRYLGPGHSFEYDLLVTVSNVPYKMVKYLKDMGVFFTSGEWQSDNVSEEELCDMTIFFPIFTDPENREKLVLKNSFHYSYAEDGFPGENNTYFKWNDSGVGHAWWWKKCRDTKCNKDFVAVVKNIDPQLTPEEDNSVRRTDESYNPYEKHGNHSYQKANKKNTHLDKLTSHSYMSGENKDWLGKGPVNKLIYDYLKSMGMVE